MGFYKVKRSKIAPDEEINAAGKVRVLLTDLIFCAVFLNVENNSTLASCAVEGTHKSRITVSPTEINLENATLQELLKTINSQFYAILDDKTAQGGSFNFNFKKTNFEQLCADPKSKYSLVLQPKKILPEHAVTEFRK